jgi:hypothetical protein
MEKSNIFKLGSEINAANYVGIATVHNHSTDRKPDPAAILQRYSAVSRAMACELLEIRDRHLRRLIELGELECVGKGHFKRITTKSIARYRGLE